jgi:hypothetical protein
VDDAQRAVTEIALSVLAEDGFILAGGQALAEHGVIARMSEDVDLFPLYCPEGARDDCRGDQRSAGDG